MAKSKEVPNCPKFTGAALDVVISFSCDLGRGEVEGDVGEVSALDAYGRGLTGSRRRRPECAVREHGIRNPSLALPLRLCGLLFILRWGRDNCAEDHVEVGQRQRASGRLAAVDALDVLDNLQRPLRQDR